MFDRSRRGDRAFLVHVQRDGHDPSDRQREFRELTVSAGAELVGEVNARVQQPNPKFLIGSGKVAEIGAAIAASGADLVLIDHALSPVQERNLEAELKCRVHDRTTLILDIFAQRARSHEGKLEVELAQLKHMTTRLVRGWTHLERQRGGIGNRGPGETQLETDRRLLAHRVKVLKERLETAVGQRDTSRRARQRRAVPTVALIGYTNAGKSTLFNALTESAVYAADRVFATLDPTVRRLKTDTQSDIVLADTVGFVRDLPHDLVAAFRSTLSEARDADLLLHVIDASDPEHAARVVEVESVLEEIGCAELPRWNVFNKIDLLGLGAAPAADVAVDARVSALTGAGLDALRARLAATLTESLERRAVWLEPAQGRLRAQLYGRGAVLGERVDDAGRVQLDVELCRRDWATLEPQLSVAPTLIAALN
jgi:GTPase